MERWADIPQHTGYQASTHGRIRSIKRTVKRVVCENCNTHKLVKLKGKRLKPRLHKSGYIYIKIAGNFKPAHRLVAMAHLKDYKDELEVDHIDGIRTHNHVDNLRMVTRKENMNNPLTRFNLSKRG